ncbi:MAG: hypothetical protein P8J87_18970, partial [Verrucomicrobiales bacterium]|nr:hypothetical protein [Verrucomicrobiales bacterium]
MKTPHTSLSCLIALSALVTSALHADIVIDVDATSIKQGGPATTLPNTGTTSGDFVAGGDIPIIETIDGVQAVTLDGSNDYYVGPPPPATTTGLDPVRSVEIWTYNSAIAAEETMVSWGRRGGPEGSNFSFNYGNHGTFGAVGHWGAPDIGWVDAANTAGSPAANQWHHLVYTYDGIAGTTIVYTDGQESNREENILLDTHIDDDFGNPLPITIGAQNLANGGQEAALQGSLSIARMRVHDTILTAAQIADTFNAESADFAAFIDSDNDTMDDRYEQRQFGNLDQAADGDPDSDGLDNAAEAIAGTNATNPDSDNDSIPDGDEVNRTDPQTGDPSPTNPLNNDSDGDGLADNVETDDGTSNGAFDTGTDPAKADTDGDGFGDKFELDKGSDPNDIAAVPPTDPIIVLDATALATGELPVWTNTGSLAGDFDTTDDGFNLNVETVDGVNGVFFDSLDHYTGPAVPAQMTGNGARAVTAWIHNPIVAGEETIFSWGRRGGPDKTNFSFNHGTHDTFGAVGAWGPAGDTGWDSIQDAGDDRVGGDDQEVENAWTHVAVTFDGTTTSVYTDGRLTLADANGPFNTHALDNLGDPFPFRIGAQNIASGEAEQGLRADMTIAQLSVWDQSIPLSVIEKDFDDDAINFGLRPINDTDNDGDLLGDGWELFW